MTRWLIIWCVFVASLLVASLGSAKERRVTFINTEILNELQSEGDPEICLGYQKDKVISPKTQLCSDEMLCGTLLASPEGMTWFGLRKMPNIRLNSWRQEFKRGDGRFVIRSLPGVPKLISTKRWREEAQKRGLDPDSCLTFLADAYVKAGGVIEKDNTKKTSPQLRTCKGKRNNFDQCVEIFGDYYPNCQRTVFYNDGLLSKTAWPPTGCHKKYLKAKYSKTNLETFFSKDCGLLVQPSENEERVKKSFQPTASDLRSYFINQPTLQRKQMQYVLKNLGYYKSTVDGLWGKGTRAAVEEYLASNSSVNELDKIYESLTSEVDVPSYFAAPVQKKRAATEVVKSQPKYLPSQGYTSYGNPTMSVAQALDACKGAAQNARDRASDAARFKSNSYSGNCYGNSYSTNCNARKNSPYGNDLGTAMAIGIMEGLTRGIAGKQAAERELKSCMAHYGWRKS